MTDENTVLVALRKIIRAMTLHSRRLRKSSGLTAPQVLTLQTIKELEGVSISRLATQMSLSQATMTTIIDRLEKNGLVRRRRSDVDKRVVHAQLTDEGTTVLDDAPALLQEEFVERFAALEDWEKSMIVSALQRLAVLMDAEGIDAAPMLHVDTDIT